MTPTQRQELDDFTLVLSRYPKAWYLNHVNGTISVMDRPDFYKAGGVVPHDYSATPIGGGDTKYLAIHDAATKIRAHDRGVAEFIASTVAGETTVEFP